MAVHKKGGLLGGENHGISPALYPLSTAQALGPMAETKQRQRGREKAPGVNSVTFPADLTGLRRTHLGTGNLSSDSRSFH